MSDYRPMRAEQVELNQLAIAVDRAQEALEAGIVRARAAGLSWPEIARPLGISRQAAQQRYAILGVIAERRAAGVGGRRGPLPQRAADTARESA